MEFSEEGAEQRIPLSIYSLIFFAAMSYGAFFTILPVFAMKLGASYTELGILGAAGSLSYFSMTLIMIFLSDRMRSGRTYISSRLICGLLFLLTIFATLIMYLVVLRAFMAVTAAIFWVLSLSMMLNTPIRDRLKIVGRYNTSWSLGFFMGPLIAGVISDFFSFQFLFLMLAIITWSSVLPASKSVRLKLEYEGGVQGKKASLSSVKGIISVCAGLMPLSMIMSVISAIIPGHMERLGISSTIIGMLLALYTGMMPLTFSIWNRIIKIGENLLIAISTLTLCLSFYLLSIPSEPLAFIPPLIAIGVSVSLIMPTFQMALSRVTSADILPIATGINEMMSSLGYTIGPILAGRLADAIDPKAPYIYLALLPILIPILKMKRIGS